MQAFSQKARKLIGFAPWIARFVGDQQEIHLIFGDRHDPRFRPYAEIHDLMIDLSGSASRKTPDPMACVLRIELAAEEQRPYARANAVCPDNEIVSFPRAICQCNVYFVTDLFKRLHTQP